MVNCQFAVVLMTQLGENSFVKIAFLKYSLDDLLIAFPGSSCATSNHKDPTVPRCL